ncbi:hypothetical protein K1719_040929 [Acacia pycnantha]|nr:hypothetical protein K1719_040929 [Acacia pycnantha]
MNWVGKACLSLQAAGKPRELKKASCNIKSCIHCHGSLASSFFPLCTLNLPNAFSCHGGIGALSSSTPKLSIFSKGSYCSISFSLSR